MCGGDFGSGEYFGYVGVQMVFEYQFVGGVCLFQMCEVVVLQVFLMYLYIVYVEGVVEVGSVCVDYYYVVFFVDQCVDGEGCFVWMFKDDIDIVVFVGDVLDCFVEFVCFGELFFVFGCVYCR